MSHNNALDEINEQSEFTVGQTPGIGIYGGSIPPQARQKSLKRPTNTISDFYQHRFSSLSFDITAGDTVKIIGVNTRRRSITIQNKGPGSLYLGFGTTTSDIEIPPNSALSFENGIVPNNEIFGTSQTGTSIALIEGTRI